MIPPPMNDRQCIKILPPDKKHNQPRRCGLVTTQQDLEQAQRLSLELRGQTGEPSTIRRIIRLRVCKNTHRKALEKSEILEGLIEEYQKNYVDAGISPPLQEDEELFERHPPLGRGSTVHSVLPRAINPKQVAWGSIYIFGWPRVPGLLKIGYVELLPEKRVGKWEGCHPEATFLFKVDIAFPERMETLIHADLAGKRYILRQGCPRCGRKHDEWFAVTLEEARRVIEDWREIAASPLYMEDRTLSREWRRVIGSLSQVTVSTLLAHMKKNPLNDMSGVYSVSDILETSSPSSALEPLEDGQIDELGTKLDRSLTIS